MTLFEGEQNGRYETDHLHMVLNEHIDFTEEGLSDDRKYSIFVHEYVHYYQHFATLYGSQFCKMANLLFIETRAFLEGADKVVIPFGIWEHNEGISRYRNRVKAVCGSKSCGHIVGDVEIDRREIRNAEEEKKAVKIGVYDYTEDEVYEDGFNFGYYCIIESMYKREPMLLIVSTRTPISPKMLPFPQSPNHTRSNCLIQRRLL